VKEGEASLPAGGPDLGEIGHAEAQEVTVKADGNIQVVRVDHEVAEAHVPGLETAHGAGRMKGLLVDRPAAEDLGGDPARVDALEEVDDTAVVGLVAGAWGDLHPGILQLLGDTLEGDGVGHLPADELDIVTAVSAEL
jgi:hypothetical protein